MYVREDIPCQRLTALEATDVESVWLLYRLARMPRSLSLGAVYHPPTAANKVTIAHILNCLDTVTHDHPHAGVILLGDFNRLHDAALLAYPLKQVVRLPTRKEAILDKIYTNLQDWYRQPAVIPDIGNSGHRAVLMSADYSNIWIVAKTL